RQAGWRHRWSRSRSDRRPEKPCPGWRLGRISSWRALQRPPRPRLTTNQGDVGSMGARLCWHQDEDRESFFFNLQSGQLAKSAPAPFPSGRRGTGLDLRPAITATAGQGFGRAMTLHRREFLAWSAAAAVATPTAALAQAYPSRPVHL